MPSRHPQSSEQSALTQFVEAVHGLSDTPTEMNVERYLARSAALEDHGSQHAPQAKGPPMLSPSGNSAARRGDAALALTACSVCLRVWQGSDWVDPETVIRQLRSFDVVTAPRLNPGLCDRCARSLRERRARPAELLAA
jgi:hypothetical protein